MYTVISHKYNLIVFVLAYVKGKKCLGFPIETHQPCEGELDICSKSLYHQLYYLVRV